MIAHFDNRYLLDYAKKMDAKYILLFRDPVERDWAQLTLPSGEASYDLRA